MLLDIATNVIANIVFWIGSGLVVAGVVRIGQRRFRSFLLSSNLIVVGTATRNSIRKLYLEANLARLRISSEQPNADNHEMSPETWYVEVLNGPDLGQRIISDSLDLAVVEKVHDNAHGTTVVFCLGRRADTTWAATEYLARNWRSLQGNSTMGRSPCFWASVTWATATIITHIVACWRYAANLAEGRGIRLHFFARYQLEVPKTNGITAACSGR